MSSGQLNPLLPPLIPSEATPDLPAPSRSVWTTSERLQLLIGIVSLAFAFLQSVPGIRSSLPESSQSGVYVVGLLIGLGIFFVLFGAARILRVRLQRRRERESGSAAADRVTELAVLVEKARKTWALGSSFVGSFEQGAINILNSLNSVQSQSSQVPEERRRAADRANFLFYGWRASSATQDAVFWELDRLIDDLRTTDKETFVAALLLLRQVLLGSIQAASSFADEVRRSEPSAVPEYARQAWSEFREKANRLSEDVNTLGEKTKRDYGRGDISFYFPTVRSIEP